MWTCSLSISMEPPSSTWRVDSIQSRFFTPNSLSMITCTLHLSQSSRSTRYGMGCQFLKRSVLPCSTADTAFSLEKEYYGMKQPGEPCHWVKNSLTMSKFLFFFSVSLIFSKTKNNLTLTTIFTQLSQNTSVCRTVACKHFLIINSSKKHILCYNPVHTEITLMKHCLLYYMWCVLVFSTSY